MYYIYIDEAGRGPIAGPVYVGIVVEKTNEKMPLEWLSSVKILSQKKKRGQKGVVVSDKEIKKLPLTFPRRNLPIYKLCKDSKAVPTYERGKIAAILVAKHQLEGGFCAIGRSSAKEIDEYGIVWALRQGVLRAMHECFLGGMYSEKALSAWIVAQNYEICLVIDGPTDFGLQSLLGVTIVPVIDGDARIPMIGAASILAKVYRDQYMRDLGEKHVRNCVADYGFATHKGYGTRSHYEAIERYGLHEEHRKSFIHDM